MARSPLSKEKFRRPEIFLSELLKKSAQGFFREIDENNTFLYRAVVVAVDVFGGKLENTRGQGSVEHVINGKSVDTVARIGPDNPRNSIKARILTNGLDQFVGANDLKVFWPFFPEHMSIPIKPGEHVYIIFEDSEFQHGLWLTKIPGHENYNYVTGQSMYSKHSETSLSSKFDNSQSASGDEIEPTDDDSAEVLVPEEKLTKLFY